MLLRVTVCALLVSTVAGGELLQLAKTDRTGLADCGSSEELSQRPEEMPWCVSK